MCNILCTILYLLCILLSVVHLRCIFLIFILMNSRFYTFFLRVIAPTQWAAGGCPPLKESPGEGARRRRNFSTNDRSQHQK